jgi:UDPglucose 6-dehydrogenase
MKRITVFGTGYVGLVTGTCFAEMGHRVTCVDIDQKKIDQLNAGHIPIFEPRLEELVHSNKAAQRLFFATDQKSAVRDAELVYIAVGTPPDEDGSADLRHVLAVARSTGQYMDSKKIIVNKSTVPVGTAAKVEQMIKEELRKRGLELPFSVVSNPEFLKEGTAIQDCLSPDRIVIGCEDAEVREVMESLYAPHRRNGHPILFMKTKAAEMTKYASNAMLATKISFMNEISRLCEHLGVDIEEVRRGIGTDSRIGFSFIYAGLGYGGSCFPKDVQALIKMGEQNHESLSILKAVEQVNRTQRERFFSKIVDHFEGALSGKKIAFWGLAFKPGTDDVREAPALDLIERLLDRGAVVVAFDPVAMHTTKRQLGSPDGLAFCSDQYLALEQVDALCVATEWGPFREPDFDKMRSNMKSAVVFDGRNLYQPKGMQERGFHYISIGREALDV